MWDLTAIRRNKRGKKKVERHRRLKCSREEREIDLGARNICSLSSGAACSLEWLAMGILKFSVSNKGLMWIQLTAVGLKHAVSPA